MELEKPNLFVRWILRFWMLVMFFWKYFVGVVFCLFPLTAVLVVGWTYRLMQRSALKTFWKASPQRSKGESFKETLYQFQTNPQNRNWPNWFVRQNAWSLIQAKRDEMIGPFHFMGFVLTTPFASLWENFKIGIQVLFNTWVLTLPGLALWVFAWHAGWNNSFHKVYEQSNVGILTGLSGVVLFIAAMLYVPMAQARQALTGQWRSFYEFGLVRRVIGARWWAMIALAALFVIFTLPVMVFKTAPLVFDRFPELSELNDAEALQFLQNYFFWVCVVCFPIYVFVHVAAARLYAGSLLKAVRKNWIDISELSDIEQQHLEHFGLLEDREFEARPAMVRGVFWTGRLAKAAASLAVLVVIWFALVAQIFISEFFHYHPLPRWLNQPTIHMPWFQYIPYDLRESAQKSENSKDS